MSRSDENILSLPPLTPDFGFGTEPAPLALRSSSNAIEDIQLISEHTVRQKLLMDSIAGRSRHAMRRALELDQYANSMFFETGQAILKINEAGQDSAYEPYYTAFNDRLVKTAARHIIGLLEVGVAGMAREVVRLPEKPEPKTFLQRLLG